MRGNVENLGAKCTKAKSGPASVVFGIPASEWPRRIAKAGDHGRRPSARCGDWSSPRASI